jgi:transcriptional regulator with XRE-family HTH domain
MTDYRPDWYENARHMREKLGWTHKRIAADIGVSHYTVARVLRGVGSRVETRKPFLSVIPDWLPKALRLRDEGMIYAHIAIAVRAPESTVERWLQKDPSRMDSQVKEAREKIKPEPRPKAGQINESYMEAARLFARGEIDRKELSYRLRGGAS